MERGGYRRSDRAIAYRCSSGRATFVPMVQSTNFGKCDDLDPTLCLPRKSAHRRLTDRWCPVRNVQKERAHEGGNQAKQCQSIKAACITPGQIFQRSDVPGTEEATEITD